VIFEPMVFTIGQPPVSVPSAIATWADSTTHSGTWEPVGRYPEERAPLGDGRAGHPADEGV
jgi:hypothetical protein